MTTMDVPVTSAQAQAAIRRAWLWRSAIVLILGPTLIYALYLLLIAPAQYQTTSSFALRGAQSGSPQDALSLLGIAAPTSNAADAKVVETYIRSEAMVEQLRARFGFNEAYDRPSLDPFSRLSRDASLRSATAYWRRRVRIIHDPATQGATVQISAFTPQDALRLSRGTLALSEELVNSLPQRAMTDLSAAADREIELRRAAYEQARDRLTEYTGRQFSGIQAAAPAQQALALVGSLDARLADKRTELATARETFQPGAPQLAGLEREIEALEAERGRAVERALQAPGERAAGGEIESQGLLLDYQVAQQSYQTAIQAADTVRRQQIIDRKYIVSYVPPFQPESSNWWSRLGRIVAVFFGAALLWAAGALIYSIIRDHIE